MKDDDDDDDFAGVYYADIFFRAIWLRYALFWEETVREKQM